jgi:DNA-binding NarL/FixJ family response regulator
VQEGVAGERSTKPRPPLVARNRELETLRGLLQAVRRRHEGRIAAIQGEAGIGKTRLLEEALGTDEASELTLLRGAADELGRERPFGALVDALDLTSDSPDPQARQLGHLIAGPAWDEDAEIPSLETPDLRFRIVESLIAFVEGLAGENPVLVAIDDVHWADPSTLLTLNRLAERLAFLPVALLVTCREYPRPPELATFLEALPGSGVDLHLEPLTGEAAGELAATLLDAPAGPALSSQLEGTGGNPLFVVELIGALRDEGAIEVLEGHADVREAGVPPTLRLTILRRLAFLREGVLETLGVASVLGSSFSAADLALVVERPIPALLGDLRQALDAGVLVDDGDRFRFRHDLVREAMYEDLAAPIRAGLHLQAARALASAGRPAAQAATHFALGAPAGDREAIAWLQRGAGEAAPRAPAVAARFLGRAVDLLPEEADERRALRVELARSLLWSGRLAEAERIARELLAEDLAPADAASLHYAIGRALAYQGRLEDSIDHVQRALENPALPSIDRARLLAELSHRRLLSGDLAGAIRAAEEASQHQDPAARWTALCAQAWTVAARGEPGRARELAETAVAEAGGRARDPIARIQPRLYHAFVCVQADLLAKAESLLREGLAVAEELGAAWALPLHHAGLAIVHFHAGAWDDALSEAETSLALADELDARVWTPAAHGVIASIAFRRDDFGRVEQVLGEAATEPATQSSRFWGDRLALVRALLSDAAGDNHAAVSALAEHWSATRRRGSFGEWRETAPELVKLALDAERRELAAEVTTAVEELPAVRELAGAAGTVLLCRGLLDQDAAALKRSVEAVRESPRPLEQAAVAEAAGRALHAGDAEEATVLLREALQGYEELGAAREVARVEATLRQLGIRRGRRGPRKRPAKGWDSLTPSEQRIASLVAEGLTNPQIAERLFLSRRTVETHVSHALRKLELSSRVQLAADAARQGSAHQQARTAP